MREHNITDTKVEGVLPQIDIMSPVEVQIQIREDKKVLWIHVDGQTVLRICQIPDRGIGLEL